MSSPVPRRRSEPDAGRYRAEPYGDTPHVFVTPRQRLAVASPVHLESSPCPHARTHWSRPFSSPRR